MSSVPINFHGLSLRSGDPINLSLWQAFDGEFKLNWDNAGSVSRVLIPLFIIVSCVFMEIKDARYLISNADFKQCPPPDRAEYAFIGRSNVGKSSLINMLTNKKALAKTSSAPGKTQLINHFDAVSDDNKKWYLVDLPGYGYAKVSQSSRRRWQQMIENYIRKRENLVCLFVLIDSRHEPQKIDYEFINDLGKWETPFVLVFTKSDKNKPGATLRNVNAFLEGMQEYWEEAPPHFVTSAINKEGREALLNYIGNLNQGFVITKA